MDQVWVLLVYTLPREPSAPRVALWTLPATPAAREQVRWLVQEIREAGGDAQAWIAHEELPGQNAQLVAAFVERAEQGYQEILRTLDDPTHPRADLARSYRQVRAIDYFYAPSSVLVRARLESLDGWESEMEGGAT